MIVQFAPASKIHGALILTGLLLVMGTAQADMPTMPAAQKTQVNFPPTVRDHFLANMRDHLAAVSEIQKALADGKFELAGETAKKRLGMDAPSSMACNPAKAHMSGMTQFMPEGMRAAGRLMHHAADQFAEDTKAKDYRTAIASLAQVTHACVTCHAQYKVH